MLLLLVLFSFLFFFFVRFLGIKRGSSLSTQNTLLLRFPFILYVFNFQWQHPFCRFSCFPTPFDQIHVHASCPAFILWFPSYSSSSPLLNLLSQQKNLFLDSGVEWHERQTSSHDNNFESNWWDGVDRLIAKGRMTLLCQKHNIIIRYCRIQKISLIVWKTFVIRSGYTWCLHWFCQELDWVLLGTVLGIPWVRLSQYMLLIEASVCREKTFV